MTFYIVRSVQEMRAHRAQWKALEERVALVPTMGALHAGHLALMEAARQQADRVVATIFVNPAQFAPHEDFDSYPRQEEADITALRAAGVDMVYLPSRQEMYPEGFATHITVAGVGEGLESLTRPHFFGGVATVVAKLLLQVCPNIAVFGEKDYQQLQVIRRLVRDMDIATAIVGAPTVREADGLALSSRNAYLSGQERACAPQLYAVLQQVSGELRKNPEAVERILQAGRQRVLQAGFDRVDYLALCDAESLKPLSVLHTTARLLVAAVLGKTRLIDNIAVTPPENAV